MHPHPTGQRLDTLELAMRQSHLDVCLVPMVDAFQGEYIPESFARLPYLTGFTGSAGLGIFRAVPTPDKPHILLVDGRYILQAPQEVNTARIHVLNSGDTSLTDWLKTHGRDARIGIDPWLLTLAQHRQWQAATADVGARLAMVTPNLVDRIWENQPVPPAGNVFLHPLEYAGTTYTEKRAALLKHIAEKSADALVLTAADSINWLLNIRGSDVLFNPLLLGYLLLKSDGDAILYTYPHAWTAEVATYFSEHRIHTAAIQDIFSNSATPLPQGAKLLLDPATTPYGWAALAEQQGWQLIEGDDPTALPKASKNPIELAGIRAAHVRDGLALTRFLHWFDAQIAAGNLPDELTVVTTLEGFRAAEPSYRGPSFATIAGAGAHGAIIHYRADEASNRRAQLGELFLLDSGGQYPDGTTDVTRTLAVGTPSDAMREHFTRVLKGHIALARAQFPVGTTGSQLDVLARLPLWEVGLDFDHGTGHGVGAYLCVHEGPQRISKRGSNVALKPGMVISNEPGYYAAGQYGIRIENLVAVVALEKGFLGLETLTLAPIDRRLILPALLTTAERQWLNSYHACVAATHMPHLTPAEGDWLNAATQGI